MSSLLDFVQTLAIINLHNEKLKQNEKFDPYLELTISEFFFYTLTTYDHKNPEKTIELIQALKGNENEIVQPNNFFNKRIIEIYGSQEKATKHINQYTKQQNEIIDELISFYTTISEKTHFIPSQYHIDQIDKLTKKLQQSEKEYHDYLKPHIEQKEKEKAHKENIENKLQFIFFATPIIFIIILCIVFIINNS